MSTQSSDDGGTAPSPAPQPPVVNTRACNACNRRKTKCDRARPACSCCRRAQSSCDYPTKRKQLQRNSSSHRRFEHVVQDISRLIELLDQTPSVATVATATINAAATTMDAEDTGNTDRLEVAHAFASPSTVVENPQCTAFPGVSLDELTTEYMPDIFVDLPGSSSALSDASLQLSFDDFGCADAATLDSLPKIQASISIDYASALQLVDIFFDHVQPWMPILHGPRFTRMCKERFADGGHALCELDSDTAFLLCSVFALATRFGPTAVVGGDSFAGKEQYFALQAQHLHFEVQARGLYSLETLQGSVMLSYYSFTQGEFSRAWIRTGFCVRLAQELGLCEMDEDRTGRPAPWRQKNTHMDWVQLEERRRAWWLIWDLDTVMSTMSRRPFAVDRRFNPVLLPVTDQAWFAEAETASARIFLSGNHPWTLLKECGSKSSYAWYLVARHLASLVHDGVLLGRDVSLDNQKHVTDEMMCLRLLLPVPPSLSLVKEDSVVESNWATFAHLVLASAMATPFTGPDDNKDMTSMVALGAEQKVTILDILTRWPTRHVASASPLVTCTLMPLSMPLDKQQSASSFDRLTQHILGPIMSQFAQTCKWGCSLAPGDSDESTWPASAPAQRFYHDNESTVSVW